jgi:hypothetical protein
MTTLMRRVKGPYQKTVEFQSRLVDQMKGCAVMLGLSGWTAVGLRLSFQPQLLLFANEITRIRIFILVYLFRNSQLITSTPHLLYSSKKTPLSLTKRDQPIKSSIKSTKELIHNDVM